MLGVFCWVFFFLNDMFSSGRWEQALKNKFFGGRQIGCLEIYVFRNLSGGCECQHHSSWAGQHRSVSCPLQPPCGPPKSPAGHCQAGAKMTTPIQDLLWILLILLCACLIKLPRWLFLQPGDFTQMNVLASLSPAAKIQLICKWK